MVDAVCWVMTECPQGKILRESLEALSVGLSFQKQYGMETVVLWSGTPPEDPHPRIVTRMLLVAVTSDCAITMDHRPS